MSAEVTRRNSGGSNQPALSFQWKSKPPGKWRRAELRARSVGGRGSLGLGVVHKILQFLAGFEEGDFLRRHFDLFAGLRIASNAPAAMPGAEAAKAADLDLFDEVRLGQCWLLGHRRYASSRGL